MKLILSKKVTATLDGNRLTSDCCVNIIHEGQTIRLEGDGGTDMVNNMFINGRLISSTSTRREPIKPFIRVDKTLTAPLKSVHLSECSVLDMKNVHSTTSLSMNADGCSSFYADSQTSFENVHVHLSGCSSLIGGGCCVQKMKANVLGCSKIQEVHIAGGGTLNASGCSEIQVAAAKPKHIHSSESGMSSIRVDHRKTNPLFVRPSIKKSKK